MKLNSLNLDTLKKLFTPGTHPHPIRDWFVILGMSALLMGVSAGWNVLNFLQVTVVSQKDTATPSAPVFESARVDEVEKVFSKRKEEADRYRAEYHFVDPSR
jgi:hypothetical protein